MKKLFIALTIITLAPLAKASTQQIALTPCDPTLIAQVLEHNPLAKPYDDGGMDNGSRLINQGLVALGSAVTDRTCRQTQVDGETVILFPIRNGLFPQGIAAFYLDKNHKITDLAPGIGIVMSAAGM